MPSEEHSANICERAIRSEILRISLSIAFAGLIWAGEIVAKSNVARISVGFMVFVNLSLDVQSTYLQAPTSPHKKESQREPVFLFQALYRVSSNPRQQLRNSGRNDLVTTSQPRS